MLKMVGKQAEEDSEIQQKIKSLQEKRVDILMNNDELIRNKEDEEHSIMRPAIKKTIKRKIKIAQNNVTNKNEKSVEPTKALPAKVDSIIGNYSSSDDE